MMQTCKLALLTAVLLGGNISGLTADDWPMFGRDAARNPVSLEQNPPLTWDIGKFDRRTGRWIDRSSNVRWKADLGTGVYASPVISDGLVWIGANSRGLEAQEDEADAALLRCYRERDGKLLYEYVSPRLEGKSQRDPPWHGLSSSPSIHGDQLWFFTNRCETVCLNIGPLKRGAGEPEVVWKTDLKELGIHLRPLWMWPGRLCSPSQPYEGRVYVTVPNGVDDSLGGFNVPAPDAPNLVCLDKDTGEVVWTDSSPGPNILYSEFSSPLVANIGGRGQIIVAQGDGWVRSFEPASGALIWEFDSNSKASDYTFSGGTRNYFLATPVLYEERIYIGNGRQASDGEGPGRLVCIDPKKTGDISTELAVDRDGNRLPHRRRQAVDPQKGERAVANPNSGLIWEYTQQDRDGDGKIDFEETFHRTLGSVAIKDGLLIAVDFSGLVHCLDAATGKVHWAYDMFAAVWGSPLIVDDRVYVADEDGEVAIFRLTAEAHEPLREISFANVERLLKLARVTETDQVYDLGSGDGRVVIAAAQQHGAQAVGVEIDPELVRLSRQKVKEHRLEKLVTIEHEDMFLVDLSEADVVAVFLYPRLLERLRPQFAKMKPGSRIVSHHFALPPVEPDQVVTVNSAETGDKHRLYLWTTPLTAAPQTPE